MCLFVHGPDFWIFDWEHNKSARVLPEKWLHLLFLQFVVVRIKNEKVILRNVRSDFSSVGAIKSAKIISRCIHEEVLYTRLFGAKARVRVQSHRA